jgi:hypothetical protein
MQHVVSIRARRLFPPLELVPVLPKRVFICINELLSQWQNAIILRR